MFIFKAIAIRKKKSVGSMVSYSAMVISGELLQFLAKFIET